MKIEYLVRGHGNKTIICFHGHSLNMNYFEFVADHFVNIQVISFNIFYHGNSILKEDDLHHQNLKALMEEILIENKVKNFTVLGYSLGGKFALNMVNYFPELAQKAILIAPEGIKSSNFYNTTSRMVLLRRLYKTSIDHPNWFFNLSNILHKMKIFSPSMLKFIHLQMGEKEQRQMAYNTWAKFRYIFPNQGKLKKNFHTCNIELILLMGEKDRIIKPEIGQQFINRIGKGELRMLPITHDIFREDYLQIVVQELEDII